MTENKWSAVFALAMALVAIGAPLAVFYFPEKADEVDVWVAALGALIVALGAFISAWTGVAVLRVNEERRVNDQQHELEMLYQTERLEMLEKMD